MDTEPKKKTTYSASHINYYNNQGRYKTKIKYLAKKLGVEHSKYLSCKNNDEIIERLKEDCSLDTLLENIINYEMKYKRGNNI